MPAVSVTADYLAYQARYRDVPRESDRVLIELVSGRVSEGGRVLDVGCSTGNLLRHLLAERPDLTLIGLDFDEKAVVETLAEGFVAFLEDATRPWREPTEWPEFQPFDAVILNAVLYCLDDAEAAAALNNIFRVLRPGGTLFVFDLLHTWQQRLTITEESERYGKHTLHIRPYTLLQRLATEAGFGTAEFLPYLAGLAHPWYANEPDDPHDLTSWTFDSGREGHAVIFRGGLAQPWCHALLRKPV